MIDLATFKRIAFTLGVPAITLDLLTHLSGACNDPTFKDLVKRALHLLYDRVEPKVIKNEVPKLFRNQLKTKTSKAVADLLNAIV